jgi:molybdopterin converting factor small subunit
MENGQVKVTAPGVYNGVVPVLAGESVADVLDKCGVNYDTAKQILVDNVLAQADDAVRAGQTIYVMPQVAGNR